VWANLTIKNVPQPVLRRLEARAALHRRSLNLKVVACLESLVQSSPLDVDALLVRVREVRRTSRWPRPARAIRHRWSTGPGCISIDGGLTCRFRWL